MSVYLEGETVSVYREGERVSVYCEGEGETESAESAISEAVFSEGDNVCPDCESVWG